MRESGAEVALAQLLLDYGDDLSSLTPSAVKAVTAQYDVEYATHLTLVARMYTDYLLAMLNWPDVRCFEIDMYMEAICWQDVERGVGARASRQSSEAAPSVVGCHVLVDQRHMSSFLVCVLARCVVCGAGAHAGAQLADRLVVGPGPGQHHHWRRPLRRR